MIDQSTAKRLLSNSTVIYSGYGPAGIYQYALSLGAPENELLKNTGIPSAALALDSDGYLKLDQYYQLINNILSFCGLDFGLKLGEAFSGYEAGVVGTMLKSPKTVKESIEASIEHQSLIFSPFTVEIDERDDYYAMNIHPPKDCPEEIHRFIVETIFASSSLSLVPRYNLSDTALSYSCAYSEPAYSECYRKYIKGKLLFNQSTSAIVYPSLLLDKPLQLSNQVLFDMAVKVCQQRTEKLHDKLSASAKVHKIISENIGDAPKLETVAEILDMSVSTLKRKLSEENSSYTRILEEARKDIAMHCIGEKDMQINDVARFLNISSDSNFHKSFRRWTGMTVNEFKDR